MSATACHRTGFLLAVAVAAVVPSIGSRGPSLALLLALSPWFSSGERMKVAAKKPPFAPVGNHRSRIEVDGFGRGIEQMIRACAGQAVELKRMPFDLVSQTRAGERRAAQRTGAGPQHSE